MASYLPELDALFIHVPHTGGTWVRRCLEASGLKTEPAKGPGHHGLPEAYQQVRYRFCFVRHPQAWVESVWCGLKHSWSMLAEMPSLAAEKSWSPFRVLTKRCSANSFDEFVTNILTYEPAFVTRMLEAYIGPRGFPKVNAVGQQEHLADHLQTILNHCGFRGELADLPPVKVNPGPVPRWNNAMLDKEFSCTERAATERWYCQDEPHFVELA